MPTMPTMLTMPTMPTQRSTGPGAEPYCPVFQHVMELLGRRWTGVILRELLNGPARFSDLRRAIPGLTDRLLADRLDELEREQLVNRSVANEVVLYELTERGADLRDAITAIVTHSAKWASICQMAAKPGRKS